MDISSKYLKNCFIDEQTKIWTQRKMIWPKIQSSFQIYRTEMSMSKDKGLFRLRSVDIGSKVLDLFYAVSWIQSKEKENNAQKPPIKLGLKLFESRNLNESK